MRIIRISFYMLLIAFILHCTLKGEGVSHAADVAKIGIVDFQTILLESSSGKGAKDEITKMGKQMEADLKKKGTEIEDRKKKLEQEALVMKEDVRSEKEREIRISIDDFRVLQQKYQREIKEVEKKLVDRIRSEILNIIEEIGKKEGYLLIIEKTESGALYAPNQIDITNKIIQKYNADFAQKGEKEAKGKKK